MGGLWMWLWSFVVSCKWWFFWPVLCLGCISLGSIFPGEKWRMPREGRIICAIYVALISLARCTARARAIYGNLIICVSICQQFKGLVAVSHLFAGHVALLPLPSVIRIRKLHSRVAMGLHRKSGSFVVRGLQNEIQNRNYKNPFLVDLHMQAVCFSTLFGNHVHCHARNVWMLEKIWFTYLEVLW